MIRRLMSVWFGLSFVTLSDIHSLAFPLLFKNKKPLANQ